MKKTFFFIAAIVLPCISIAQLTYKPGDTVTNLRQYVPNPKKLVIFDFWALSCSSCIAQFPKLDSLQRVFNDEIDIVLVNEDKLSDSNKVNKFARRTNLRSISGDASFVKSFPHLAVPHYVLTNSVGVVVGQTHAWDITAENIKRLIDGSITRIVTKEDVYRYNAYTDSLGSGRVRSILTLRQPKLLSLHGNLIDTAGLLSKVYFINRPLSSMIRWAYRFERKKPKLHLNTDTIYCYELVIPPTPRKLAHRIVQQDLERYFGIKQPNYGLFSRRKFLKNPK